MGNYATKDELASARSDLDIKINGVSSDLKKAPGSNGQLIYNKDGVYFADDKLAYNGSDFSFNGLDNGKFSINGKFSLFGPMDVSGQSNFGSLSSKSMDVSNEPVRDIDVVNKTYLNKQLDANKSYLSGQIDANKTYIDEKLKPPGSSGQLIYNNNGSYGAVPITYDGSKFSIDSDIITSNIGSTYLGSKYITSDRISIKNDPDNEFDVTNKKYVDSVRFSSGFSPLGPNGSIQFNNINPTTGMSSFAGSSNLTFSDTNGLNVNDIKFTGSDISLKQKIYNIEKHLADYSSYFNSKITDLNSKVDSNYYTKTEIDTKLNAINSTATNNYNTLNSKIDTNQNNTNNRFNDVYSRFAAIDTYIVRRDKQYNITSTETGNGTLPQNRKRMINVNPGSEGGGVGFYNTQPINTFSRFYFTQLD